MYRRDFAEAEMAWTSMDKVTRLFKYGPNQIDRFHPTQKPVKLYEWMLKKYANPGDRILDTHGGSCSIAIACDSMGFDLDVYEIDAEYYEKAVQRLEEHRRQQKLFP